MSTVAFGAGTGTLNFNHTNSAYAFTLAITGDGTINALAGNTFWPATRRNSPAR